MLLLGNPKCFVTEVQANYISTSANLGSMESWKALSTIIRPTPFKNISIAIIEMVSNSTLVIFLYQVEKNVFKIVDDLTLKLVR